MRIAIIGPAHPYKGGIAQHTTELAHRLTAAGHEAEIISWRTQWPFFYPGQQFIGQPELPEHHSTRRVLSWRGPVGWTRWGRKLRSFDRIVFVWWVPTFLGPGYLGMLKALGRKRPPVTVICHNVLPHKSRPGDKRLARMVLRRCDQIITHSPSEAQLATKLAGKPVETLVLPMPLLKSIKKSTQKKVRRELLFFGFVRPYKGVDVLLEALATVPDVRLTIAGEVWGDPKMYTDMIDKLGLQDRVKLKNSYIPANELAELIAAADAVILPYKSGTGSWNVSMAHAYGTPVIATRAGSLAIYIQNGVDGLLCAPDNVRSLSEAIKHFYGPGVAERLRKQVPKVLADADWQRYVETITS